MKKYKRVSESATSYVEIVNFSHLNGYKRIFGGQLMSWIDTVAGVVARRHSENNVATVTVDNLNFKLPAYRNDTIYIEGKITAAFNTSMEICVKSYVEELNGERTLINTAYLVMVALDIYDKPTAVPKLILETYDEKKEYELAVKRNKVRKALKYNKENL
ncbi:MAG: acyl-CoA thioesterase [Clostridia bacterium]|nr:acyl-CoA thioesterase [Clostridia bacterium]